MPGEREKCLLPFAWVGHLKLMFSAIAPLPDNLEEYMFAGLLGEAKVADYKCLTQDLWVPAEADIVIEGYTIPGRLALRVPLETISDIIHWKENSQFSCDCNYSSQKCCGPDDHRR